MNAQLATTAAADPDGLRYYQREAVTAALEKLRQHKSTLVVMATGLGKTQCFGAIAKHWPGRVLVLAHRKELIDQARKRIEAMTGEWVEVEQAQFRSYKARIVVGSTATMGHARRLKNFAADAFTLIIIDEAHHSTAETYQRIIKHFPAAKILGVTATPDRGDSEALGKVFESVAYTMDISEGIGAGYLVPIRATDILLSNVDLSAVGKTGKDLAAGQLDEAMLKGVEGIVKETIALEPHRQAIAFFPGVRSAQYAAERFNALEPESARFVSGETPDDERDRIFRDFRAGVYKRLCSCMVPTEGFDAPFADCIILGRPTLSRALFAQMCGRGTRTEPGLVDHLDGPELAAERRTLIALSAKPDLHILDFKGLAGKHSLIGPEDLLGGKYTDEEVREAKKKKAPGGSIAAALEAARAELAALRTRAVELRSKVTAQRRDVSPFGVLHIDSKREDENDLKYGARPVSERQRSALLKFGLRPDDLRGLSHSKASKLLTTAIVRANKGLASYGQLRKLQEFGVTSINISRARAAAALDYISSRGWGKQGLDPAYLDSIIRSRMPGEDG